MSSPTIVRCLSDVPKECLPEERLRSLSFEDPASIIIQMREFYELMVQDVLTGQSCLEWR